MGRTGPKGWTGPMGATLAGCHWNPGWAESGRCWAGLTAGLGFAATGPGCHELGCWRSRAFPVRKKQNSTRLERTLGIDERGHGIGSEIRSGFERRKTRTAASELGAPLELEAEKLELRDWHQLKESVVRESVG
ncbi:hypothetical protein CDL15_Pgr026238 [Punica granatum]|uniref:Uncharacterized protein n=1 Tax=Punica granatum TaxID=22663 RepID=A0A218VTG4_PUNGR|nr:hypothetical protein CDL15_Pgr026238 [Punica granatum]